MTSPSRTRHPSRREFALGAAAAALAACVEQDTGESGTGTTADTTDATTTDATTTTTSATGETTGEPGCGDADAWATGGTAAMTAKDCYPDPFAAAITSCPLYCETTAGPCTSTTIAREDVSEGLSGLPVRLALKIVDADTCAPMANATVEIWHTQRAGVYSGVTPAGAFCYGDDPDAETELYFRGTQTTTADGRVDFDTCFPGWYPGRAIHIHFRVSLDAVVHATSQLFFADTLNAEIFADHPEYSEFGPPNTTNVSDSVIGDVADLTPYVLTTARMPDGAMLASKRIAIRPSPAMPACQA